MKVKQINLGDDDYPEQVTVEMTLDEAALVARLVGKEAPPSAESSNIYRALSRSVFNTFWENGIDGVGLEEV